MFTTFFAWLQERFAQAAHAGLMQGCQRFSDEAQAAKAIDVEARPAIPAESNGNGRRLKAGAR